MSPTSSTIYYPDVSLNILNSNGVKTCHIEPESIKLSVNYVACNTLIDASNVTIAYGDGSFTQMNNNFFEVNDGTDKVRLQKSSLSFFNGGIDANDIVLDASDNLAMGTIKPSKIEDSLGSYGISQSLNADVDGNLVWADVVVPNLSTVLAQDVAGDAGGQTITNLASLACGDGTVNSLLNDTTLTFNNVSSLVIGADVSGDLSLNSIERTPFDAVLQKYLPLTINGTKYYIPSYLYF